MTKILKSIDLDIVKALLCTSTTDAVDVIMTMCHFILLSTFV